MMDGDEIASVLQNIPCSFSLSATVVKKTKTSLEVIIAKLMKEDQMCIYDTEEEAIRDHNLLSYLFWCTGNANKAFEFNKKALERSDRNITAVVNKIWFYLELHSPYEAKTAFEHFQTLKQNTLYESILLIGKAEIAYAYTRLGFQYYERAVDEFNKVLSQADKWPDMDKNSVYLWKAGLGLTLRRLSHTGNVGNPLEMQRTKQRLRKAVEVFVELVESDWDSKRNKAFSYVQLAQVAESVERENLPNEYFPIKYRGWDIETFYRMAEKHCKEGDTYTLERYGNFLRKQTKGSRGKTDENKLKEAEKKLRKSIAVMPTSTAHHYLALVLKTKLNNDLKKSKHRSSMSNEANTAVMRSRVKCPTKMLPYPKEDKRIREILHHLEQAIVLGDNRAAIYDKGLILRATQDFDEAISTFQSLIKEETSLMYLANAYEQCALCCQSKLEDVAIDVETKKKLLHDRKSCLIASVAISTKMVARMPDVTNIWDAGTTLKTILIDEGKSKETLKELAVLSERLSDYKDAITYCWKLLSLDKSDQENPEILMGIIRDLMADGNFIEAISVFDLIMMTPNGKRCIDEKLYCSALIEAGFEGVQEKHESNAGPGHLKAVLYHSSGGCVTDDASESPSYQSPAETDVESFDIFILCNENDETTLRNAKQIVGFLQARCNVTATLNREDVVLGRHELSTMSFISQSQNVVVCLDETASLQGILQRGIEHAAREKPNITVVLMNTKASIPNCLMMFPSILYEAHDEVTEIDWMKALFYKIARC